MRWVRNLLICVGAYWISHYPLVFVSLVFDRLGSGVAYTENVFTVIAMGALWSLGRSICAAFGAAIVTLAVEDSKPYRWAVVVAVMYVIFGRAKFHWGVKPTGWDRVYEVSNTLWPAVVCISVAFLCWRVMRRRSRANDNVPVTTS